MKKVNVNDNKKLLDHYQEYNKITKNIIKQINSIGIKTQRKVINDNNVKECYE